MLKKKKEKRAIVFIKNAAIHTKGSSGPRFERVVTQVNRKEV